MPDYERGAVSCCSSTWDKDNGLQHAPDCLLGQAVKAMSDQPTVILIHVLENGRAVCGYGDNYSVPGEWPQGHKWCHRTEFSREVIERVNEERKRMQVELNPGQGVYCFTPHVRCEKCVAKLEGSDVRTGMESNKEKYERIVAQAIKSMANVGGSPQEFRDALKAAIVEFEMELRATVGLGGD